MTVFDLPEELLYTLEFEQDQLSNAGHSTDQPTPPELDGPHANADAPAKAASCSLCGLAFESVQDQRGHVRSDLHNYNLKQKLRGRKAVSESEFEKLIANLDESLSGSDSDPSSTDDDRIDDKHLNTLSSLLKQQAKLREHGEQTEDQVTNRSKKSAGRPPLYWFKSSALPRNTSLGVYRAIFSTTEQEHEPSIVETLQKKQLARPTPKAAEPSSQEEDDDGGVPLPGVVTKSSLQSAGPHYFLCMIGGGHFAAMLVALTPKRTKKGGQDDRSATVLAHKTFHRYTTRRKQGGSQSANDNAKGNAHSAGSSLRRYNESALESDIRSLLADWRAWIDSSELLFVRATGSTNRRVLFGPYDEQVLTQKDSRLRSFPFNTRRATQSELMRAFVELTRVKVTSVNEEARAKQIEEERAKASQRTQRATQVQPTPKVKASKEEEETLLHTTQIQALIRRTKAPALLSYLQTNSLSPDFLFSPRDRNHHAPTPLHFAAASSAVACVSVLLLKAGSDPSSRNDDGRTAYELAGDRATRDAFALARGQLGETKWLWDEARVPPAITQAEATARATKEKAEKASEDQAEKERRQAELQRLRAEDQEKQESAKQKKFGAGKTISTSMTAEQRRMNDAKGMTDEMRLRMEREQRARAAEERMRRLQAGP